MTMEELDGKELYDLDAETALLGSILIDPSIINELTGLGVSGDDFYLERHGAVYSALLKLWDAGEGIDLVTLSDTLEHKGVLDELGGVSYLAGLYNTVPTGMNFPSYARIVRRFAMLRRTVAYASRLATAAYEDDEEEVRSIVAELLASTDGLAVGSKIVEAILFGWDMPDYIREMIDKALAVQGDTVNALDWPERWRSWRKIIAPLYPGQMAIMVAGTGKGKSTLAHNLMEYEAMQGRGVIYVHFENTRESVFNRMLARWSGIDLQKIRAGELTDEELDILGKVQTRIGSWITNLHFLHTPRWTMEEVAAAVRTVQAQTGASLVIIDYLNKANASGRQLRLFNNEWSRMADDAETVKSLGEQLGVPTILLAQMDMAEDEREGRPTLKSLFGSKQVVMKSQVVVAWKVTRFDEEKTVNGVSIPAGGLSPIMRFYVLKQNEGATGDFQLFATWHRFLIHDITYQKIPQ